VTKQSPAVHPSQPHQIVQANPSLTWDSFDAYLFDIDGTLLRAAGGVHNDAFPDSVREVTGHEVSLERVFLHGNTDTRILAQMYEDAGVARHVWEPYREDLLKRMATLVHARQERMEILVIPGIRESLENLRSLHRTLGVATGNLELIGWLKIELGGLRGYFDFGGFSDQYEDRGLLIGAAAAQARRIAGPQSTVCVVGDTPADIAAARANDLPVIAVATGAYSIDQLLEHQPDIATTSMLALLRESVAEK
jgi:phosphoglycolate phosphatase-like HAD superfamily hydrolase